MKKLAVVAALVLSASVAFGAGKAKNEFTTTLAPSMGTSNAKADLMVKFDKDAKSVTYKLNVADLEGATGAHLHMGKKGADGPPVLGFFHGKKGSTPFSGVLAEGKATAKDLMGPMKGKQLSDLKQKIEAGEIYVNIHTEKVPKGELRGQLE